MNDEPHVFKLFEKMVFYDGNNISLFQSKSFQCFHDQCNYSMKDLKGTDDLAILINDAFNYSI